jgi:hypothetical protein
MDVQEQIIHVNAGKNVVGIQKPVNVKLMKVQAVKNVKIYAF